MSDVVLIGASYVRVDRLREWLATDAAKPFLGVEVGRLILEVERKEEILNLYRMSAALAIESGEELREVAGQGLEHLKVALADTARLDWLEKHGGGVDRYHDIKESPFPWRVESGDDVIDEWGETAREALDRAIEHTPAKHAPE